MELKRLLIVRKNINEYIVMSAFDYSDQKTDSYDFYRKPQKRWKKVCYKPQTIALTNSWITYT